uniref:Odorant receptor n=1 Tax=Scaeva pyrastri TaxID=219539 RepID=A0A1B3B7A2_SCAPY|nr:putative odorant receptor OR18 [Scaeva pyrastri]
MIIPILFNISEFIYLIVNWGNVETLILSSFMTAILFNSIFRIVSVLLNQKDFVKFIEDIQDWFQETENQRDIASLRVLNAVAVKADTFSKLSLFLGSVGGVMTIIVPLCMNSKELPYPVWIPTVDVYQSPCYEIIFAAQVLFVMPFIIVTYIPFTNLFINYLMFGIGSLQILQNKLENVIDSTKDFEQIDRDLEYCIQYHNKIIRFCDTLSTLLSLTNLMEFLMFSLMLCVLLFFILIVDSYMLQINAAIYIGSIFYVVLLSYWHANEFSYESLKVAEAAYNSNWTICNSKIKKSILIMILRSQNALQISAGGMYPMTLETFQSLLSASYSYFTVLNGMNN